MRLYTYALDTRSLAGSFFFIATLVLCGRTPATQVPDPGAIRLDTATIQMTVKEAAAVIAREYMDAAVGKRVADHLARRLTEGYYRPETAKRFAERLNRDLMTGSNDKHLGVAIIPQPTAVGPRPTYSREEQVRRSNAGVQRVEILSGNVGYLNLTAFWRLEEARDAITQTMKLLSRADALIVDMRDNRGGSPETVALLSSYLFAQPALPLFDIVPRTGDGLTYETLSTAGGEERRPVFVLTSQRTFSAGEGFAFLLQERGRALVVGEQTPGAANPGRPYPVNALFEVTVPNGQVRSAVSGRNWEGVGVTPDVRVRAADALHVAHVRALQRLKAETVISAPPS